MRAATTSNVLLKKFIMIYTVIVFQTKIGSSHLKQVGNVCSYMRGNTD